MDEINELEKLAYRILNYIEEQIRELQTAKDPNAENKLLELKNAMDSFRENYTNTEGKLVKFFATDDAKINIKTTLSGTEKYSNLMIYGRDSIYWNMRVNQTIAMFENLALKKFGK
ncbi:MAG: hypothetical protein JO149_02350 [Gammaproteobacteria bacterium]|nr:hypothetical protein [Gammaproteobacteria bacterium]